MRQGRWKVDQSGGSRGRAQQWVDQPGRGGQDQPPAHSPDPNPPAQLALPRFIGVASHYITDLKEINHSLIQHMNPICSR